MKKISGNLCSILVKSRKLFRDGMKIPKRQFSSSFYYEDYTIDYQTEYHHKSDASFIIKTTPCYEESLQKTTPQVLYMYWPQSLQRKVREEPFVSRGDFKKWAQKGNRVEGHILEVGLRLEAGKLFEGLKYSHLLFSHKNFLATFLMDSVVDKISQEVTSHGLEDCRELLTEVTRVTVKMAKTGNVEQISPHLSIKYPQIVSRFKNSLSLYQDILSEASLLFRPQFVTHFREHLARFSEAQESEILHREAQKGNQIDIHPGFWGLFRPYFGAFIFTGSPLYGDETHFPSLDDPIEHEIHMIGCYDNELISFAKEQDQVHFNLINGLINQGVTQDKAFEMWTQKRNLQVRLVDQLVNSNKDSVLGPCYERLFMYQLNLFNYHFWTTHRYGWYPSKTIRHPRIFKVNRLQ
jgi:hypothetical protein